MRDKVYYTYSFAKVQRHWKQYDHVYKSFADTVSLHYRTSSKCHLHDLNFM